jgi:hypothetical protein
MMMFRGSEHGTASGARQKKNRTITVEGFLQKPNIFFAKYNFTPIASSGASANMI